MSTRTCQHPDGCVRGVKAYGWCKTHWERIRRSGVPGSAKIMTPQPLGRECTINDCTKLVTNDSGYGMCGMHYQRWRKYGDVTIVKTGGCSMPGESNPNWTGDEATYNATHSRLRHTRGQAADYSCADCGSRARHWSYNNQDPQERRDSTTGLRYSVDLAYYEARCVRCHSAFDRAARALLTGARP